MNAARRVLVVDDDAAIRQMMVLAFETAGFAADQAADPAEALAWVAREGCPDLVVSDLTMPGKTGEELIVELHNSVDERLPTLLVSGAPEVEEAARRCGATGWLKKPFRIAALLAMASDALSSLDVINAEDATEDPVELPKVRIVLSEDHTLVADALHDLLELEPDFEVVGMAADGLETIELCRQLTPDVLLLDLQLPDMDGVEVARALRAECPDIQVIVVTGSEDRRAARALLGLGVRGYLAKTASRDELAAAVRAVSAGHTFFPSAVARLLNPPMDPAAEDDIRANG